MKEDTVKAGIILPGNDWDKCIKDLSQWSLGNLPDIENPAVPIDYYVVLRSSPTKILFDTNFVDGSSGSSGVSEKEGNVVLIVSGGFPLCHYTGHRTVDVWQRVEYGYGMEDICEEMKQSSDGNIDRLARQIFGEFYDSIQCFNVVMLKVSLC
jgi:hypothetical protein